MTQLINISIKKYFTGSASNKIKQLHMARRRKYGYQTPECTALDVLGSEIRKEKRN